MVKYVLVSLAALAAALPAEAAAQPGPRSGHSWGGPGGGAGAPHAGRPQQHHRRYANFRRIDRGGEVPRYWWGPQFHVQHWQMYGFARPAEGHRWIRYYDDALLVDRRGRVRDARHGFDWDRYGDRWGYDQGGIPMYVGNGDFHPGRGEYDFVEHYDGRESAGGWDYSEYGYAGGPPPRGGCGGRGAPPCGPGPAHGGSYGYEEAEYGYGHSGYGQSGYGYQQSHQGGAAYGTHGYGAYGYGYGGGTVIVETTVVTGGSQIIEEVIEEEVYEQQRARRVHRRPPPPPPPVRRPIRGERG